MILPHLVSPQQTSFVPGRHITENTVIAQEVIYSMRRKTGKRGQMIIKVVLEKAYDRITWSFIHDTLLDAAISFDLVQFIMDCITHVKMNILWEGEMTEDFVPSRGIRQGDHISPYIFVLCIERLSHGILHAVNMGDWRPMSLVRNETPLTYLFFADLLLVEATCDQARVIWSVIDAFCASSGAKVNKDKT